MVWGTLGGINFEVGDAPTKLTYKEATQYAKHDRILGKATLQNVGQELQSLDLSFVFHIGWCNPDEQLQRLQDARIAGEPMPLVLGGGRFEGNYVVESLRVILEQTDAEGQTEQLKVDVGLMETVDLPEPETLLSLNTTSPFEVRA